MRQAVLQAQALCAGYGQRAVLSKLDLRINSGELICLLGPNGAGKSTLMRTLSGMQASLSGQIQLAGKVLSDWSARERAQRLAVVLTERVQAGLLSGYELVALGRHPHTNWIGGLTDTDHSAVVAAIQAVNAEALADRAVMELSDGERQRLLLARALAQEPQLLVLDEITAFLDLPRRIEAMTLLQKLAHQRQLGVLLSTHDLELALRYADQVWLLNAAGELLQGAPEDLVRDPRFAQSFAREGLSFDPLSGGLSAITSSEARPAVFVQGTCTMSVWLRRGLQRKGFVLAANESQAAAIIQVISDAELQCEVHGERTVFTAIEPLLKMLQLALLSNEVSR
jgi:iron complex transport system ATP-binding protein